MKKGLITSILALTFTGLQAQPLPATPKLVVTLGVEELTEKSKRLPELNDLIDEKTMRWLELSEIEG